MLRRCGAAIAAAPRRARGFAAAAAPAGVNLVEVGPRDGLQNEKGHVDVDTKVELVRRLVRGGVQTIEVGAFVSPTAVPQMADTAEVVKRLLQPGDGEEDIYAMSPQGVRLVALTPNEKGLEAALAAGVDEVAVFTAVSESFTKANTNCTVAESLERIQKVTR